MEEKIKEELKISYMRKSCLKRLFDEASAKACSFLMLKLQWEELDAHFNETQKSLEKQADEASLRERCLNETRVLLEKRAVEIEKKEKEFGDFHTLIQELREEHESRENALTVIQGSIEQCTQELCANEQKLCHVLKSVEDLEEKLLLQKKELNTLRKSVDDCNEEICSRQKQLNDLRELDEKLNLELVLKKEELCSTQGNLDKCCKEVVLKTEELKSTEECLKNSREELQLKKRELILEKGRLDECCRELSANDVKLFLKTQELSQCKNGLDECCKQLHSKTEELLVMKRTVNEELSAKDAEIVLKNDQLGLAKTELAEYLQKVHLEKEALRKSMEEKERQFGVLTRAHKGLCIQISEKDEELLSTTAKLEERVLELLFKTEELNTTEKSVTQCREELQLWEAKLCSVKKTLEERLLELESKGKEFTKVSNDLECKEKELIKLDFLIKESVAEFDLFTKQLKQKQIDQNNSLGERRLNLVLAEHLAQKNLVYDEVTAKLSGSADPAKWVLEQLHSNSWKGYNDSTSMRRTCILLLEQLMTIVPIINPQLKEDALKLANEWKAKLRDLTKNSLEVLCFLMLLAAFKLFPAFNKDELLHFVNALGQDRQVPELRKGIENARKSPRSDKPALVKDAKEVKVEDLTEVGRRVDNLQSGSNKRIRKDEPVIKPHKLQTKSKVC